MTQQVRTQPIGDKLFFWYPVPNDLTKNTTRYKNNKINAKPFFCNAIPNSQGEDWISRYVYQVVIIDNTQKRLAYVECDYVQ